MKRLAAIALLLLAACTPKEEELARGPKANGKVDDKELAGGAPASATVLPGIINLVPPPGYQVVADCEKIVAPDYDHPPQMTCLLFSAPGMVDMSAHSEKVDQGFVAAMGAAGWQYLKAMGAERYFERLKPGTDCADLSAVVVLEDQLADLLDRVKPVPLPTDTQWLAYAIPASIREACGADRMTK